MVLIGFKPFEKMPGVRGYKPLVVLSGSMEPAIRVGSVILVGRTKPAAVKVGDIITFKTPGEPGKTLKGEGMFTTHRVIKIFNENGEMKFKTKGDANEEADRWTVSEDNVLGRVKFSLPYLGYFSRFLKTPVGFILLIILPALLIIMEEIRNILKNLKERKIARDT